MDQEIEKTADGLAKYIIGRTNEIWEKSKSPYLLSNVSPELKLKEIDYKTILSGGMTLKAFVATLANDVRLVLHPTQKSKIGIVPKDVPFTFEALPTVAPASNEDRPRKPRQPSQRFIVLQFLTALSKLSEDDLKDVSIPVRILAKLVEEKQ